MSIQMSKIWPENELKTKKRSKKKIVQFDNAKAGAKLRMRAKSPNNWVPVTATSVPFRYEAKGSICQITRRQFPLVLAHGMTIHKSQGAQYAHLQIDLNKSNNKNPKRKCQVRMGQLYAELKVVNFHPNDIKVNITAIRERWKECVKKVDFAGWHHPAEKKTVCM